MAGLVSVWKVAGALAIALMMLPAASLAAQITDFGDGRKEADAFPAPFAGDTVNLTVPAECHVRKVSVNVSTAPYDPAMAYFPESLGVRFNGTLLYRFDGTGFGAFGDQRYFTDGSDAFPAAFSREGGVNSTTVRIPRRAVVENATFGLECAGGSKLVAIQNITVSGLYSTFGDSVACAGDLDGDGIADFIVGDPTYSDTNYYVGRAMVFFGNPDLAACRVLNLTDGTQYSYYGGSVAGAGDLNGDGYDDVIVGAYGYTVGTVYYLGAAYVYLGGSPMDAVPDLVIYGCQTYGELGYSVAGAGDLNCDGYDDFLVGEPYNDSGGQYRGAAHLFFGGKTLDDRPDIVLKGSDNYDYFGLSVTGAGDLNGDGWPDFAVGAVGGNPSGSYSGEAFAYFGGPNMDGVADVYLPGPAAGGYFGNDVSPAGDVNGDGFGDLIVGAYMNNSKGTYTGAAYLFLGGKAMDGAPDLSLVGESGMDQFGASVAGAFDINRDGYDDIAVGAPYDSDPVTYAGRAYIFFGGPSVNTTADINLTLGQSYDMFGSCVAGGSDINGDGIDEFLVGASRQTSMGGGRVVIYSTLDGVLDPGLEVSDRAAFSLRGYVNTTFSTPDLSPYINDYLQKQFPSGWDAYGNTYCDVPLNVSGGSEGSIALRMVNLTYSLSIALPDFTDALNGWIAAHRREADAKGELRVPLAVESATPGRVRFTDLNIVIDEAPRLVRPVPDLVLEEDSYQNDLVDLGAFFEDDFDNAAQLRFSVVSSTFPEMVALSVYNGHWLSADALEGDLNDNWTGTVEAVVRSEDHWGSGRSSNTFRITVRNVNDPPVVISEPPTAASGGDEWVYRVLAVDGDRDRLAFSLALSPAGMAINGSTGVITWIPQKWGRYPVSVSVSDGASVAWQNFTLAVPNRPPVITGEPRREAFIGQPYSYAVAAADPDGDALSFSLATGLDGFSIDAGGLVSGVPLLLGEHELLISVSDGRAEAFRNFTLTVIWPNRAPFVSSNPVTAATEGLPYTYDVKAYDNDKDALEFSIASGPRWLSMDPATGRLSGTPEQEGNFTVLVTVRDGRGGEGSQEFILKVAPSVPPSVTLDAPAGKVGGTIGLSGAVRRGTREVLSVELRLDGGQWRAVAFNSTWSMSLDTKGLRTGDHAVEVRAYDGRDYSATASATLEVDNSGDIRAGGTGPGASLLAVAAVAGALAAAGAAMLLWKRKPAG